MATGFSNVGFHVRLTTSGDPDQVWTDLIRRLSRALPAKMPLSTYLQAPSSELTPVGRLLGSSLSSALAYGLQQLIAEFGPDAFRDAEICAPALEGLGQYPKLGSDLKAQDLPIWGAGDVTGMFRGLVAGLVSGHFAGLQATKFLGVGG